MQTDTFSHSVPPVVYTAVWIVRGAEMKSVSQQTLAWLVPVAHLLIIQKPAAVAVILTDSPGLLVDFCLLLSNTDI